MNKGLILSILFVVGISPVFGQRRSTAASQEESNSNSKTVTISAPSSSTRTSNRKGYRAPKTSYWAIGASASTNSSPIGGISIKNTFGKNPLKLNLISVDFVNINDYRQFKSPYSFNGTNYIEGKINYLYVLRPSYGKEFAFLQAADDTSPSLKGFISTGPSIGFESPYYVQISQNFSGRSTLIQVPYSDIFANIYPNPAIVGSGGWFKGLSQSSIQPGWHAKGGINLDYRNFKGNYFGIEIGASIDYFANEIVQLYNVKGRNLYSGAYICMYFGKSHR